MTLRPVPPYSLWIGNAGDVRRVAELIDHGIAAVVDLAANEPIAALPREFVYLRFPLHDGAGNDPRILLATVNSVVELLRQNIPTLVACSAGMSRSPAITAAAIATLTGRNPSDCLIDCAATGPADVSPALWHDILTSLKIKLESA